MVKLHIITSRLKRRLQKNNLTFNIMSYTILYRSMFIKTKDDKYIPMIELGDNNCYENSGRNARRSRSWQQWNLVGDRKLAHTREKIMQDVEKMIDDKKQRFANKPKQNIFHEDTCKEFWTIEDVERQFGYFSGYAVAGKHCNDTSAQQIRNFFQRGFEQAVSMDTDHVVLDLHWCTKYPEYMHRYISNEEELLSAWDEELANGNNAWLTYHLCAENLWKQHRRKRNKQKVCKIPEEITLSHIMRYCDYEQQAKVGDRILVGTSSLTRTDVYKRRDVYKVVSTSYKDGTLLRKHGCRHGVFFPKTSWSYSNLYAAVLTEEEYKKMYA